MQRLDVFVAGLAVELCLTLTRHGIVADEAAVVLVAVQFEHIDGLGIRAPGDVGEIDRARVGNGIAGHTAVGCLKVDGLVGGDVIDTHRHHMGIHAGHGIFVGLVGGTAGEDVDLWVVGHHRLVHAVEGQALAVRTPEGAFSDAELVSMYGGTVHHIAAAVCAQLALLALTINDIKLMVFHVSRCPRMAVPVVGLLSGDAVLPHNFMTHEVNEYERLFVAYGDNGFVRIGKGGVHEVAHIAVLFFVAVSPAVDVVESEEQLLLTRPDVNEVAFLHIGLHELVAPPCQPHVLGLQVTVVRTTEVEVFQCK